MTTTFNKINDLPFVVRHIRPIIGIDSKGNDDLSPFGGISLGFLIDGTNETLTFTITSCRSNERFVRKNAFKILSGRIKSERFQFTMTGYDPGFSLVENAYSALATYLGRDEDEGWADLPFNLMAELKELPSDIASSVIDKFFQYVQAYYGGTQLT